MEQRQPAPLALKIVAGLFFLSGLISAVEVLIRLTQGSVFLNIGVLGLFIGVGLLRYRRGWRTCALVFLWLAMIVVPVAALVFLASNGPLQFTVLGQPMGNAPKAVGLVVAAIAFALALWQYRVLIRPEIRQLFVIPTDPVAASGAESR